MIRKWFGLGDVKPADSPAEASPAPTLTPQDLAIRRWGLSPEQFAILRLMFSPAYYRQLAALQSADEQALFNHYLQHALADDVPPSPLFDPNEGSRSLSLGGGEPAIVRWLKSYNRFSNAPTRLFDPGFYLALYGDVAREGIPPFEHFVKYGLQEGRKPNALFDPQWYAAVSDIDGDSLKTPAYQHYLTFGLPKGMAPRQVLAPLFDQDAQTGANLGSMFGRLVDSARKWSATNGHFEFAIIAGMFLAHAYDGGGQLGPDALAVERFVHFLDVGFAAGLSPGPMFDEAYYRRALADRGVKIPAGMPAIQHYLRDGLRRRIVPTSLFDEAYYLREHRDIANAGLFGFEHFVVFGIFEGRRAQGRQRLRLARSARVSVGDALRNWRFFWAQSDDRVPQDLVPRHVSTMQRKLTDILNSDILRETMARAQAIDPGVGEIAEVDEIIAAPYHDHRDELRLALRKRLVSSRYDTIICVPWIRAGGADLVACLFADAIRDLYPDESVLILRTDAPNFERPDWVPEGIEAAHISDLISQAGPREGELLLFSLLIGLSPKRVVNVNSRRCWRVLERFGKRFRPGIARYSYLFCWDHTPTGLRAGYPTEFFASTAPNLDGVFTDTDYLREELVRMYAVPDAMQRSIHTLHSPAMSPPAARAVAELGAESAAQRPRPLVLWAGRLDRQKRFDLVQQIAQRMPEVDFACWGAPMLDAGPDHSKTPGNLFLSESFASLDDLPLEDSDAWLYTSAWDGMPTILIELAQRGAAIVASSVGGVPELIDETTAWPVVEIDDAEAYVAMLSAALSQPQERVKRAKALQAKSAATYERSRYRAEIARALSRETQR